jgi:hypothetical protein
VLPCVLGLRTPPLRLGGLQRCHVHWGSGPHHIIQAGSGTTTRPSAPNPASPSRRSPMLTCTLWLQTAPRLRSGLRCLHVSYCSLRLMSRRDKERLSCNGIQQGSRVSKARPCVTEAPARRVNRWCYHDLQTVWTGATASCYSASPRN